MVQLNKTHSSLGESTSKQAVACETTVTRRATVQIESLLSFVASIHQGWDARLHFKGKFVLSDPRLDLWVLNPLCMLSIEVFDRFNIQLLLGCLYTRRIVQVQNRFALTTQLYALKTTG